MSRRSRCAMRCACSFPRRWRWSVPRVRGSCANRIARPVALLDRAIVRLLPAVPRPVVRKISERYIAGTDLADACRVVKRLNATGKMATVDVLGEEIANADEARAIANTYREAFATID